MSTNLAEKKVKGRKQLNDIVSYIMDSLQGRKAKDENEDFIKTIYKAKQEMLDTQNYFDSVTEPELIDHAIYRMEAARSQYVYLLKLAKEKGLSININI